MIFSLLIMSFVASCMGEEIIQELWVTGDGAADEALEISSSSAADVQQGQGMLQEQQPIVAPTSGGTCGPSICDITCTSSQFCSHTGAVCFMAPCCPAYECKNKEPSTNPSPETQAVSKCDTMTKTFAAITRARMGLDCGGEPTNLGDSDDLKAVVEAIRSSLGTEDEALSLFRKLSKHMTETEQSSRDAVCSSVRMVEDGLKTSLAIHCHEEHEASFGLGGSCSLWSRISCNSMVIASTPICVSTDTFQTASSLVDCVGSVSGQTCKPCVCQILNLDPKYC